MTRSYTRYRTHTHIRHSIRIKGKEINIDFARIVYRCEECLGKLRRKDAGLVCTKDENHRGFIHRDEAEKIAAKHNEEMEQVESAYEIVDGQIVAKEK